MHTIGRERLHPYDLYHMIDKVRGGWTNEEQAVTPRLQRLKWHLEELPDPYRMEALQHYETVTRARTVNGTPWLAALASMRQVIAAWGRSRDERLART